MQPVILLPNSGFEQEEVENSASMIILAFKMDKVFIVFSLMVIK